MMLSLSLFIALNALVLAGSALVVRNGLCFRDTLGIALATTLISWLAIVLGLELLSLFALIRLGSAFGLAGGVFLVGLGVRRLGRFRAINSGAISGSAVVAPTDSASDGIRRNGSTPVLLFLTLAVAVLTVWGTLEVLITGLLGPVVPVSDAPIYHLYFAVRWWQSGSLAIVPTPFGESAAPYFPANGDVWFTWLLLPWSWEIAAKVGQWPFLWLSMAAIFGLATQLGARRQSAAIAAALWGTSTLPLINSGFADVDLVMAAWYLVATWFLVRYHREHHARDLACCAVAMGSALGTKTVAILFVPWIFLAAAFFVARGAQRSMHGVILVLGTLIPTAFWYLRNIALTGNPLYPLNLDIAGLTLLRGWYTRETLLASRYHMSVWDVRSLGQLFLRGMDPILVPVWLAGLVASVVELRHRRGLPLILVGLALLNVMVYWLVNPYQTQDRFLFASFALLAVPTSLVFDRWTILVQPYVILAASHMMVETDPLFQWLGISEWLNGPPGRLPPLLGPPLRVAFDSWDAIISSRVLLCRITLLAGLALSVGFGTLAMYRRQGRALWGGVAIVVAIAFVAARVYLAWIPQSYAQFRFVPFAPKIGYTPGWLVLEELSRQPRRVAYAGTNLPFYLFGSRFENHVQYVNIDKHREFAMHQYHELYRAQGDPLADSPTPDWDRRTPDEQAWLENLRAARIDLLFVGLVNAAGGEHNFFDAEQFPIERSWADRHPEVFRPVHADSATRIYEVHFPN